MLELQAITDRDSDVYKSRLINMHYVYSMTFIVCIFVKGINVLC